MNRTSNGNCAKKRMLFGVTGVLMLSCVTNVQAEDSEYEYALFDFPHLHHQPSGTQGISDDGIVVGASNVESGDFHATLWFREHVRDLGSLADDDSQAWDINRKNQIIGYTDPVGDPSVHHAFLWENGAMIDLGTLGGEESEAYAINDLGQVVGQSDYEPGNLTNRAFLWQDGRMVDLGTLPGGGFAEAWDINENGLIVGRSTNSNDKFRAVMWSSPNELIDLGSIGGSESEASRAYAINDLDQIVGISQTVDNGRDRPFFWENGEMVQLPFLPGYRLSVPHAINNKSQIVGVAFFGDVDWRGVIWEPPRGRQWDLNELIAPANFRIWNARDINESGQIAVEIRHKSSGDFFAGMLTPVSPELSLSDPAPGFANEVNTWTVTDAEPGSKIVVLYGRRGGGEFVPNCDILDAAIQINNAKVVGSAIADANGEATIQMYVPPAARNAGDILFQAVSVKDCEESQLVVFEFD